MQKNTYKIYFISILLLSSCSHNTSKVVSPESNDRKMENNKVKVSIEHQKNKIMELEGVIVELNSRIEYQENILNTLSGEFKDQIETINRYDASNSDVAKTLIRLKNKFEVLEDRAFYTDSVYFEIINDLVMIDSKLEKLSVPDKDNKYKITDEEYSRRYYSALKSFIDNGVVENSLDEFSALINADSTNSLSDNCQYWIGEIYYKQKLFKESIIQFKKVFKFSDSNKLDDAQYKIILCYINLNNYDAALREVEELNESHSDSEYIEKAYKQINKLK